MVKKKKAVKTARPVLTEEDLNFIIAAMRSDNVDRNDENFILVRIKIRKALSSINGKEWFNT